MWTQVHRGRCHVTTKAEVEATIASPETISKPPDPEEMKGDFPRGLEGPWPYQNLYLRFLISRTLTKQLMLV